MQQYKVFEEEAELEESEDEEEKGFQLEASEKRNLIMMGRCALDASR